VMEGSLCLIDGRVRRKVRHCSKLMCWKHAGGPSEQIAVEAGYPSSMIVIEDQFATSRSSWQGWRLLLSGSQEIEQGHSSKIGIRLA
jgi:hypothetical protein